MNFKQFFPPQEGEAIRFVDGKLIVPDRPIIPFVEGDGIGKDIWPVARKVFDSVVQKAYGGRRKVIWFEVFAGEKANQIYKDWLPSDTLKAFKMFFVSIKGPLTTPIGKGMSSLNVRIRKLLDLYVCVRPIHYFEGTPSPVKNPEQVNMVVFRENTEDIYAGIEFDKGSQNLKKVLDFLKKEFPDEYKKIRFPDSTALGLKPVSEEGSERLVRAALLYAFQNKYPSLTLVHKGNIMKFTEGGFRNWGYNLVEREFKDRVYTWRQWEKTKKEKGEDFAKKEQEEALGSGKILVKDVIADICFQQVLTRPKDFGVLATLNLNGDYLSDALAAQVGGIGIAPGGNVNYQTGHAVFEATHGTAPKYAGLDKVNPGSLILSGEMLFRYIGWNEVSDLILKGLKKAISKKRVTYDFARLMREDGTKDVTEMKCSQFGDEILSCL